MKRYTAIVIVVVVSVFVVFGMLLTNDRGISASSTASVVTTPPRILVGPGSAEQNVIAIGYGTILTIREEGEYIALNLDSWLGDSIAIYTGVIGGSLTDTLTKSWQRIPLRSAAGASTLLGARITIQDAIYSVNCNVYVGRKTSDIVGEMWSTGMITQCFEAHRRQDS